MDKTKEFIEAEETLERELSKRLGEEARNLLDKIDLMLAEKQERSAIEEMIANEIALYTKETASELRRIVS